MRAPSLEATSSYLNCALCCSCSANPHSFAITFSTRLKAELCDGNYPFARLRINEQFTSRNPRTFMACLPVPSDCNSLFHAVSAAMHGIIDTDLL